MVEGVGYEYKCEGKVDFEGTRSSTDREALRLCARVQTRWHSVFECINRALQLKDVISKFSRE